MIRPHIGGLSLRTGMMKGHVCRSGALFFCFPFLFALLCFSCVPHPLQDFACIPVHFFTFLRSFNTTMVTVFTFDRYYIAVNRKTIAGPKAWLVGSVKMKIIN